MTLYRSGTGLISEEAFDKNIAEAKERDRKLYLEAGCPSLDEWDKECPDAKFLSTAGIGLRILRSEREYDHDMTKHKRQMRVEDVGEFNKKQYYSFQTVEYTQGCTKPTTSRGYPPEVEYHGGFTPKVDRERC